LSNAVCRPAILGRYQRPRQIATLGFWRRGDRKRNFRKFRGSDEAVTLSRNRFNIKRLIGGFAKCLPQLVHRGVDVRIVMTLRVGRPQSLFQLIASDHFALLLQQHNQNLVDLALQAQARASTKDLLALLIYMKRAETQVARFVGGSWSRPESMGGIHQLS